jgi:hypothetical protein
MNTHGLAGETAFPYEHGERLRIVRGGFAGKVVRVDERSSFWSPESYVEGDPAKGLVCRAGWQVVVDIEVEGEWLYFTREHESEVKRLTERVD